MLGLAKENMNTLNKSKTQGPFNSSNIIIECNQNRGKINVCYSFTENGSVNTNSVLY